MTFYSPNPPNLRARLTSRYLYPGQGTNVASAYGSGATVQPNLHEQPQSHEHGSDSISLLQAISKTLGDVQMQLSTIQEQNTQRDETLRQLEMDIKEIKGITHHFETPKSNCSKKSPRGLSACVRKVHSSLDEEEQYRPDERVNSSHNQEVTSKITKDVMGAGEYSSKEAIGYAAKKYHEYLVRQEKPITDVQKKFQARNSRIVQRRQRLFERRRKFAIGREIPVMQALNEKFMSDEETDNETSDFFIRRSPTWRSEKLNRLIQKLDKRYEHSREKKDNSRPSKKRKVGDASKRLQPRGAPCWAIISSSEYNTDVELETPSDCPSMPASTPTRQTSPTSLTSHTPITPTSQTSHTPITPTSQTSRILTTPTSQTSIPPNTLTSPSLSSPASVTSPVRLLTPTEPYSSSPPISPSSTCTDYEIDSGDPELDTWIQRITGVH